MDFSEFSMIFVIFQILLAPKNKLWKNKVAKYNFPNRDFSIESLVRVFGP